MIDEQMLRWRREVDGELDELRTLDRVEAAPVFNVRARGAHADDSTDDTSAIQTTLDNDGRTFAPVGTYLLTSALTSDGDFWLEGDGINKTVLKLSSAVSAISATISSAASTTLSAEAEIGDSTIEVTSASGIQAGDLLILESDVLWYYDNRGNLVKGEQHRVRSISGTTITVTEPVMDNYDISGSETVTVKAYRPRRFVLRNLSVQYDSATGVSALAAGRYVDVVIDNVEIKNAQDAGIILNGCHGGRISGVHMDLKTGSGSSVGYGIQVNHSYGIMISDSHFTNVQRGIDFSGSAGVSRFCAVSNCIAHSEERSATGHSGFGTHGTAEAIEFNGCMVHGFRLGYVLRGSNISINGGLIVSKGQAAAISVSDGADVTINGLTYSDTVNGRTQLSTSLGALSVPTFIDIGANFNSGLHVVGCKTRGILTRIFNFGGSGNRDDLHIVGNHFNIRSNAGGNAVYLFEAGSAITIRSSTILDNEYTVTTGTKNVYHSNVSLEFDSCRFDNWVETDTSLLEVWSGSGTLANVDIDLLVARKEDYSCRLVGRIKFDMETSSGLVRLNNMPQPKDSDYRFNYVREDDTTARLQFVSSGNDLYISEDNAGYNTGFPAATGYVVDIDIEYRV